VDDGLSQALLESQVPADDGLTQEILESQPQPSTSSGRRKTKKRVREVRDSSESDSEISADLCDDSSEDDYEGDNENETAIGERCGECKDRFSVREMNDAIGCDYCERYFHPHCAPQIDDTEMFKCDYCPKKRVKTEPQLKKARKLTDGRQ
jgi:hypothetical protein